MKKNDIHILVVDDDSTFNNVLKELIERSGFKVTAVATPQEASNVVRLKTFHLAIIDCMLPMINGIDLAKQLLTNGLKGVPIILMSGIFRDEQFAEEAIKKSGAIEFIAKPFDTPAFIAKLNTLLSPLLDYKGGSLESLMTKIDLTKRESKKSLDYIESVVGYDLMLIFNVLMHSKLSGYLNVTDKNKKLYGFTLYHGQITDVDTLKNVKEVASLIAKMGLVSEAEATNMISMIDKRDPIGFLVQENLISPHLARIIKIDKILEDYKKLVISESVNVNFIENKDLNATDIIINKENFDFLNYEICTNRVPLEFIEDFFDKWLDHTIVVSESFSVQDILRHVSNNLESLIKLFKSSTTLNSLFKDHEKESVLQLSYYLLINRLIYFSEEKISTANDPVKRFRKMLEDFSGKNAFEIFQYFGCKHNPSPSEVEKVYKEFAKANHPDKLSKKADKDLVELNNKVFSIVSEAYTTLTNKDKRNVFVNELKQKEAKTQIQGEELLDKATELLEKNQFSEAYEVLQKANQMLESKELFLTTLWARCKTDANSVHKDMQKLREQLDEFDLEERKTALYQFVVGLLYVLENQFPEAEKSFNRALDLDKSFISVRRELAVVRSKNKVKTKGSDFLTGDVTSIISGIFNKKKSG